jgi:hypothetical protein
MATRFSTDTHTDRCGLAGAKAAVRRATECVTREAISTALLIPQRTTGGLSWCWWLVGAGLKILQVSQTAAQHT